MSRSIAAECSFSASHLTIVITSDPEGRVEVPEPIHELCRNSEYVCPSAPPVFNSGTHVTLASTIDSSPIVFTETFRSVVNCAQLFLLAATEASTASKLISVWQEEVDDLFVDTLRDTLPGLTTTMLRYHVR